MKGARAGAHRGSHRSERGGKTGGVETQKRAEEQKNLTESEIGRDRERERQRGERGNDGEETDLKKKEQKTEDKNETGVPDVATARTEHNRRSADRTN